MSVTTGSSPQPRVEALPPVRTTLLGRGREADELHRIVMDPALRLLTLIGPGGVGKTCLALHVASGVLDAFDEGVAFVPLASIRDPRLVLLAIGQAYGLLNDPDDTYEDGLIEFLRGRRSLLVLDNLEQVLGVTPAVARLLDACPDLTILATSQIALGLPVERAYPLKPLPTLEPASTELDELVTQDAFALFVERARSVDPGFEMTPESSLAVAGICHRLGGLPLAIELAAARSNVLSPHTLLERLDGQLRFLAQNRGDVPERQRTMRAAVAWSYNLLDPVEQGLFRRLSVFSGGFAADATTAMYAPGDDRAAGDVLHDLVSHSLVQEVATATGEPRYLMLESLRSYGLECLEALEEEVDARLAHASWVTRLAEDAKPGLLGPDQLLWLRRLDAEMENIRSAVAWSLANDHSEFVLRIAGSIWHYFPARGLITEGRTWLAEALVASGPAVDPHRAKALNAAGHLAHDRRDLDVAHRYFSQARHLAAATGDRQEETIAIYGLGNVAHIRTQFAEAFSLHQEGIALAREIGDERQIAVGGFNLGMASFFQGKLEDAVRYWEASREPLAALGDLSGESLVLSNIGSATIRLGDLETAKSYITRAMELQRMLGTRTRLLSTLNNLAIIHIQLGEFDRARELFEEALAMHREDGNIPGQAQVAHGFANLELDQGNVQGAASRFLEAVQLISGTEDNSGIFDYTGLLVAICEAAGRHAEVAEMLAADERLRDEVGFEITPDDRADMEKTLAKAQEALGPQAFEEARAAGSSLDLPSLMRRMPMIARQIVGRRHAAGELVDAEPVAPRTGETSAGTVETVLTARELEILRLLAAGRSTTEIAEELFVSARTVSTHVTHILEKLGVPNRTAAVAHALREGVV